MSTVSWQRLGGFAEGDGGGGVGKEVLGRWIGGEDMETFPEDMFETVKARRVRGGETGDGELRGGGQEWLGWWRPWNSCF